MFKSLKRKEFFQILLTLIVFMIFLITLRLINDKNIVSILNYLTKTSNESTKLKPRVFCMITTRVENHMRKAIHVKNTWAKRCDQFLFISSANSAALPAIKLCDDDNRNHLWCKTKSGLHYIYDNYVNHFDWFLKADDDSYIIIENLKSLLSSHSPESPLYFGCNFKYNGIFYMSGGAGYVLSREALRRFVVNSMANTTDSKLCKTVDNTGVEDLEIGRCLQNFGVTAGDSRDESLKPRFFPLEPWKISLPTSNLSEFAPWFNSYSVYYYPSGPDCCSPTLISFHYVSSDSMYLIDFMLYNVKVVH